MTYAVENRRIEPQRIACVHRRAKLDQLTKVVPAACGDSWNLVKKLGVKAGRNVAVYLDCDVSGEINMEIGQEAFEPFSSTGDLFYSSTPGGEVITTAHIGPYDRLGEAHDALRQWAADHKRTFAGPNWEIYGHWTDDANKLRTDVFYLLTDDLQQAEP
ncbi:MAG TPA: GyrI-like domain-containing protein [Planctomycetaceae bacterium]|nr:GyrI-like domain-containing protein [Planctomycetaceae bacterium]